MPASSSANSTIKILAISGSLRANSSNNSVLTLAAALAPSNVTFINYDGLGALPQFDDSKDPPGAVIMWRQLLKEADGVLICSPEYAFGVPGALKNALDWTVSSGELVYKPLALITAATGGNYAHAALMLTLKQALSCNMPDGNDLLLSYIRSKMDQKGSITDPETIGKIKDVVNSLVATIVADAGSDRFAS
jgi:NAD(P)H-dependent FMN reductase